MLGILGGLLKIIIGLISIVGLAYLLTNVLSRRLPTGGARGQVRVLGHLYLGGRRGVSLVRVADAVLVLGVTDHNVTLLERISEPEKIQSIEESAAAPLPVPESVDRMREGFNRLFQEKLASINKRFPIKGVRGKDGDPLGR